jgi:hypothetical protein
MQNEVILRIRFPYIGEGSTLEHIELFEAFLQNVFYLLLRRPEVISFEISVIHGQIRFYIVIPRSVADSVKSLFFSVFPNAEIKEIEEYDSLGEIPREVAVGYEAQIVGNEAFSLRTAGQLKSDPLNSFFNFLSSLPRSDALLFQLIVDPIDESFEETGGGGGMYNISEKEGISNIKIKFEVTVRVVYFTTEEKSESAPFGEIENAFSPFATDKNYLHVQQLEDSQTAVDGFFNHKMSNASTFSLEELSSLYHFPNPEGKISGVDWLFARKAEPPMNLPTLANTDEKDLSMFGETDFRGRKVQFGIKREDRRRHLYVAGKSGVGKSRLLEKLIGDDIKAGKGVCVIDPHGDLVQDLFYHVPESRINDVVYFSPSDLDFPIAFNPLENVAREYKQQVTQGLIEIFKKFFGADWTPKIEHVFRFTVLALLDFKKSTMMGIQKMLTDRAYRQMVIAEIQDQVVKKFWANEFSSWSEKFDNEAIVPLINKLGQFLSNEMVRNIVAQPKNKVDFSDIMNNEKILLVELSKGKLGEENASLLGSLLITKIEQEGMARAYIEQSKRKDFYLYVDEFQNFATKTFDNIFSEARKYRLDLTVSHQYLGQLSDSARETIFGNVGSMINFRLGADDAHYVAQELAPRFEANDIMNLGVREFYIKMSIDGALSPAFSAMTMTVPDPEYNPERLQRILDASRSKYATPIGDVEREIEELYENFAKQAAAGQANAAGGTGSSAGNQPPEEETFEAPLV